HTLMEYSKQWNSPDMRANRQFVAMHVLALHTVTTDTIHLERLEQLLELLEDVSTLAEDRVLSEKLVWDSSLGWYASRYFFYSEKNGSIQSSREKWGSPGKPDDTYWEQLQTMYGKYLKREGKRLRATSKEVEDIYFSSKDKFIASETSYVGETKSEGNK